MVNNKSSIESDLGKDSSSRAQSKIIRDYLDALERNRPRRGRKRTRDTVEKQLTLVENQLEDADSLERLHLVQRRIDLENELENLKNRVDIAELEARFIGNAKEYSERKGLSYEAWHTLGIHNDVLTKAGIPVPKITTRRKRI